MNSYLDVKVFNSLERISRQEIEAECSDYMGETLESNSYMRIYSKPKKENIIEENKCWK